MDSWQASVVAVVDADAVDDGQLVQHSGVEFAQYQDEEFYECWEANDAGSLDRETVDWTDWTNSNVEWKAEAALDQKTTRPLPISHLTVVHGRMSEIEIESTDLILRR